MIKKYWYIFILNLLVLSLSVGCSKTKMVGSDEGLLDAEETVKEITSKEFEQAKKREEIIKSGQGPSMTLMVYMIGSDLEAATAAATNDMNEMLASGADLSKVKVLVYTGGSPKWHQSDFEIPTDQHTVFELTKDGFVQVKDFEVMSMGEPNSLSRFLNYGYENYTSESYGLILWNHGNGPVMGYGNDLLYDKDALTLPEIEAALKTSPFGTDNKLAFIGFDACLMASAELACMVDDYGDYMIASQEVEPGFGWNYEVLKYFGKTDAKTLIQLIVEDYINYSNAFFEKNTFFKSEVTLAAVDLSYAAELESAIDIFFGAAAENVHEEFNELALNRVKTRAFGRATTGSEYDLVDMQALMRAMGSSYKKESKVIQDILDDMIIYSDSNTVESCGLSLYYPYYNKKYYEASWKEIYSELGLFPNYMKYLESYGEIWLGTDMKEYFAGRLVASEADSGTYTLQLNEEQNERYADAGFYILRQMGEDGYSAIYYSKNVTNEKGILTAKFDGNVLYYGNDLGFKGIPVARVLDEVDGKTRYTIFPTLTGSVEEFLTSESMMCRLVVSVDSETKEVNVLDFSENSGDEIQTGKRPQVNLEDWVQIEFYEIRSRYLTRDEEGRIKNYWEWPEGDWILWNEMALADGLNFTYEPIYDDGENYYLMFDLMDVQGNHYSSELFKIELEEAPPVEEMPPIDAGTLEETSLQIFEQEGVALYLDLIKDHSLRQTSYCFRAENSNDFPVRIKVDEMWINKSISCTDAMAYLTVNPGSTAYDFVGEISKICMLENMDLVKQLNFCVRINNTINDQTLMNDDTYQLTISDAANPKRWFVDVFGAHADEQILLEGVEDEGIKVTLQGAGYELNQKYTNPNGEYASFAGTVKIENVSGETQNITVDGIEVNGVYVGTDRIFTLYDNKMTLEPEQMYIYGWEIDKDILLEQSIEDIQKVSVHLTTTSERGSQEYALDVALAEEE